MRTQVWSENLRGKEQSKDLDVDVGDNVKMYLRKIGWTGFILFRLGTSSGLL
jgi:hypothetical protein